MNIKRNAAITLWVLVIATALALTWTMHERANAAPVHPTWQQSVITVDDEAVVAAAQQWHAPVRVVYAERGADVRVKRMDLSHAGKAGGAIKGDALPVVDGDRITGCTMRLDVERENAAVRAHEFGHCLGVAHLYTERSHSIMVKGGDDDHEHGSDVVTEFDRAALGALYARK
jgi:hypothetical protein